jgi:hypothetical protein
MFIIYPGQLFAQVNKVPFKLDGIHSGFPMVLLASPKNAIEKAYK